MSQTASGIAALVDAYLELHAQFRPVDLTFMGLPGHDHRLPPAGPQVVEQEREGLERLRAALDAAVPPQHAGEQLDVRLLDAQLTHAAAELNRAPRVLNPAWYTGEAAFGIISLLLPQPGKTPEEIRTALTARLSDMPRFLNEGLTYLHSAQQIPADWSKRAATEAASLVGFLRQELWLHPHADSRDAALSNAAEQAAQAAEVFALNVQGPLGGSQDVSTACGEAHLDLLMRRVHGLPFGPQEALAQAEAAFAHLTAELEQDALPFGTDWQTVLAGLDAVRPDPADLANTYQHWHQRALEAAEDAELVTAASDYGLAFRPMPDWARQVSRDLYFLFYRSPAAARAGTGSVYWVVEDGTPPSVSFIKLVHAVHHGSVGHHTQNARARQSPSQLARLGGTDGALGLTFLSSGTAVEGWACYAEDLLLEAGGFYTPEEGLLLKSFERRNAACCIADIKLHLGQWSLEQMRAFYRDEVGFPEARVWSESTRNSMLPATRLMYWLGTQQIRRLRAASPLPAREFHNHLLAHGHAPLHWLSMPQAADPLQPTSGVS
ncbi:DUF885 family protein [Deinococcus sp. QL22]|uniref:DUF885 family protein n=1 Tax=Deinococcus sp. QL22 TaxID=2939437 RepID=UPI0020174B3E|nr:DUF885 family protein [Deinococcus sp. QL22]UQN08963.1 DUF885 domain-containing protein [Deinococcus sp. QL22]